MTADARHDAGAMPPLAESAKPMTNREQVVYLERRYVEQTERIRDLEAKLAAWSQVPVAFARWTTCPLCSRCLQGDHDEACPAHPLWQATVAAEAEAKGLRGRALSALDGWLCKEHPKGECDGACVTTRRIFVEQAKAVIAAALAPKEGLDAD